MLVQGQCGLRSGHFYAFLTSESDSKMQNTLYKFCAIHWSSGMIQKTGVIHTTIRQIFDKTKLKKKGTK